jgi:hypothetical protein
VSNSSLLGPCPIGNGASRASVRTDPPCIDLAEHFGRLYRVRYEESYFAQYGRNARVNDPWLKIIPCQRGHIYPFGGNRLAATTNARGVTARRLAALDFATIHQDGDDGITILFPADRMPEVAALMKPRRRRHVSEAERARLAALGAKYGFQPGTQTRSDERPCVPEALDDPKAIPAGSAVSGPCSARQSSNSPAAVSPQATTEGVAR